MATRDQLHVVLNISNVNLFWPNVPFPVPPENVKKTFGFLTFSGSIEMNIALKYFNKKDTSTSSIETTLVSLLLPLYLNRYLPAAQVKNV